MLIFLTLVGAAILALLVVVIYLNDRVNELERKSSVPANGTGASAGTESAVTDPNSWRGLGGKKLWDVMTGKKGITNLDEASIEALRSTYQLLLSQHIESLFRAGQSDARQGNTVQPSSVKTLPSPRGTVQSWIPLNHANALYRAGHDSTKADIFEAERARMTLDEVAQILFTQVNLPLTQPFSDLLMADPVTPAGFGAGGPEGTPALDAPGALTAPSSVSALTAPSSVSAIPSASSPPALAASSAQTPSAGDAMPASGGRFSASAPPRTDSATGT